MLDISATTSMNSVPQHVSQAITSYFLLVTVVILVTRVWITKKTTNLVKPKGDEGKPLPGPRGIPIFGNMFSLGRSAPHISLMALAKKFGSIFQIRLGSRPVLVLNGYKAIHNALVKQSMVFAGRPKLFTFELVNQTNESGTSLSFCSGDRWKLHRKLAESSLRHFTAGSQVKFVESVVSTEVKELVQHIQNLRRDSNNNNESKACVPPEGVQNIRNVLRLAASNIMCWFMFSKRHTYDDQDLLRLIDISDRFTTAAGSGNPVDFMPWLRVFLRKTTEEFTSMLKEFHTFVGGRLNEHHEQYVDGSERDILDHLITTGHRYSPEEREKDGLTERMLLETCFDYFGASFETVSSTLEWCFLYMVAHPEVQVEIQRELDTVVGRDRLPALDDREKLPFTESCLLEIQRHASTIPLSIPHSTTADTVLDGYFVPKDTVVFVNLYSAHYDPEIWSDPGVFNASRFLAPDGTIDLGKKKHVIPFSVGRRRCVGSDLARIELFLFFSIFLQQFSLEHSTGEDVSLEAAFGLSRRAKDFDIKLTPRS